MSEFKVGDRVFFGRHNGEKTRGTIIKVNRVKCKVRQDESRGTTRNYPIGTIWTVPPSLLEHDPFPTPAEEPKSDTALVKSMIDKALEKKADPVVGATVVSIQKMSPGEMKKFGWYCDSPPVVLSLSTGAKLYAMSDEEGNAPGHLVYDHEGSTISLY